MNRPRKYSCRYDRQGSSSHEYSLEKACHIILMRIELVPDADTLLLMPKSVSDYELVNRYGHTYIMIIDARLKVLLHGLHACGPCKVIF